MNIPPQGEIRWRTVVLIIVAFLGAIVLKEAWTSPAPATEAELHEFRAYVFDTSLAPLIITICISTPADVAEYGLEKAPGACTHMLRSKALKAIKDQRELMRQIEADNAL
jgi:hypothetical protein